MEVFGEMGSSAVEVTSDSCCDVCSNIQEKSDVDLTEELKTLYNAMEVIGSKDEVKIVQWI